jgi:hypothetical protein
MLDVLISWLYSFFAIGTVLQVFSPILLRTLPHAIRPQGTSNDSTESYLFGLVVGAIHTLRSSHFALIDLIGVRMFMETPPWQKEGPSLLNKAKNYRDPMGG